MSKKNATQKSSLLDRALNAVEIAGNKLPHPVTLFACLALFVIVLSAVLAALGVSATGMLVSGGELKETTVTAVSLLTKDGMAYILSNAVNNFTSYAPLGMVLVAMLGVGVAEQSGMINTLLKKAVSCHSSSMQAWLKSKRASILKMRRSMILPRTRTTLNSIIRQHRNYWLKCTIIMKRRSSSSTPTLPLTAD